MNYRARLACVLALSVPSASALAQDILYEHHLFVTQMTTVGDVDGDGVADFVLASPGDGRGKLRIFSGATQLVLFTFHGDSQAPTLGMTIAAIGDVDQDGITDLAASAEGYVRVFSLGARSALYTIVGGVQDRFGFAVCSAGDVNGDGCPDLAVGAPQMIVVGGGDHYTISSNGPGYVQVLSGRDGSLLRTLTGPGSYSAFGGSLSNAGDMNGDGIDDLLVSQYLGKPLFTSSAKVRAFSGASGQLLLQVPISPQGAFVLGAGDVDADGVGDLAVTDPSIGVGMISGATGAMLYTRLGITPYDSFGVSISRIGDIDGDGASELLVGATQQSYWGQPFASPGPGYAQVLSGRSGVVLRTFVGSSLYQGFGWATSGLGDLNGDGKDELMVAAPSDGVNPNVGLVRVFSGREGFSSPTNYCVGDMNLTGQASISQFGSTSIAVNQWTVTLSGADPGKLGVLFCGPSPTVQHFSPTGYPGYLCIGGPTIRLGPAQLIPSQGALQRTVDLGPASPFTIGSTWYFQWAYYSASLPRNTSDGLAVTFTP